MLTPDYYEDCADDIINLYAQLDEAIIADITRRIIKTGRITDTAKWQIKQAQEMGLLYDDIISEIGRRTDATDAHIRALFEDAGVRTVEYDADIYRSAGLVPVDIRQSPAMMQVLNAGFKKTLGNMKNLTLTTANTSQNAYINACNLAYMKITSGAFSYQEAIRQAIQSAAQQGATVLYPSGHTDRIDVAVRRAVLTGVGQTCRTICEMNAVEMGCDLMEISAHSGARPDHAEWQGQLVSLSGRKGYLTKDDIGYGTGAGFGGWNCRHDWFPYFEGISTRNYTEKALKQMNAKCIEYNGKKYTEYEISQIQRKMERDIRSAKREKVAYMTAVTESDGELKAVMEDALKYANSLVRVKQAKMRDFINQTGEQRQYFREQNYGRVSYSSQLQYYRPVTRNDKNALSTQRKAITISAKHIVTSVNGIYLSDRVYLKPKKLHMIDKSITEVLKLLNISDSSNKPQIIVITQEEMQTNAIAAYNPIKNIMYIIDMLGGEETLEYQERFACPKDMISTVLHEFIHWKDAEIYRQKHGEFTSKELYDAYIDYLNDKSKKQLDKLCGKSYNFSNISDYAKEMYDKDKFFETYTEYRVKQILEE